MIDLHKIDPKKLSSETIDAFAKLGGEAPPRARVELITVYAQTGEMRKPDGKRGTLISICIELALLAIQFLRRPFDLAPARIEELEPTTEIAVVLLAAHARTILAEGKAVTCRELATLAGIDESMVRKHVRSGEIASTQLPARSGGHQIKASTARAWLVMRAVPGFTPAKGKKKLRHLSPKEREAQS